MVAAFRAARAAQRGELRANLHQSHLARRRSREERLGRETARPDVALTRIVAEPPAANEPAPGPDAAELTSGSVFANLVSIAVAERHSAISPALPIAEASTAEVTSVESLAAEPQAVAPEAAEIQSVTEPVADQTVIEDVPAEAPPNEPNEIKEDAAEAQFPEQPAAAATNYDPPLAEIGFGPGMLIRLSQLGLHTTGDLAQANAGQLRAALGDISRLVDVETWISNARQTSRSGS
jgi:hypothetical protein